MPGRLILSMLLVCLSGCAGSPNLTATDPTATIPMAQPMGPARRITQQITASWPGRIETMLCVLELDKHHIAVAGLSTDGMSLFNLNYDGKKILMDKSPLLSEAISPELIIKDLQLAYWPVTELQKILPYGWRLEAGDQLRRLFFGNELWTDVTYNGAKLTWPETIELTNHRYHYQLHIKTIRYEPLPE